MNESLHLPKELKQPVLSIPEKTGNPEVDKANIWFYAAQWQANQQAREEELRNAIDLGLPLPELTHSPDFNDENSKLLTTIANNITNKGTQHMLASFQDLRESNQIYRQIDVLPEQMQLLRAVISNPDLK